MKRSGFFWNLFWKLPAGLRYFLYRSLNPNGFKKGQLLRSRPFTETDSSLKGFDQRQCIFVHIPKAGGISINRQLFGSMGGSHRTIKDYSLIFSPEEFESYFKFTVVRDPVERLGSAFHFLKGGGINEADKAFFDQHLANYQTLEEFVFGWLTKDRIQSYIHLLPQTYFLTINGKLAVDKIIRLEDIETEFPLIAKRLGVSLSKLDKMNSSGSKGKYCDQLSPKALDKVKKIYQDDYRLLGY